MAKVSFSLIECIYANPEKGVTVHRGTSTPGGLPVVVKEITTHSWSRMNSTLEEALNQSKLYTSPSVVKVFTCRVEQVAADTFRTSIIQESMDCDLLQEINRRKRGSEAWLETELLTVLCEVTTALKIAQHQGISHRDIKPQNIYLKDAKAKLGDFGSSAICDFESLKSTLQGSPFFLSPELKRKYIEFLSDPTVALAYDPFKSDVYSLGVTVCYMIGLNPPNDLARLDNLEEATARHIAGMRASQATKDLLAGMLAVDPAKRWSFDDLSKRLETHPVWLSLDIVEVHEKRDREVAATTVAEESKAIPAADIKPSKGKKPKDLHRCRSCCQPVGQFELIDPELQSTYSKLTDYFCSEKCLKNFSIVCNNETCVLCQSPMIGGNTINGRKNRKMKKNFVTLECNHMLHTKTCFETFWGQTNTGGIIACGKCERPVDQEFASKILGKSKATGQQQEKEGKKKKN